MKLKIFDSDGQYQGWINWECEYFGFYKQTLPTPPPKPTYSDKCAALIAGGWVFANGARILSEPGGERWQSQPIDWGKPTPISRQIADQLSEFERDGGAIVYDDYYRNPLDGDAAERVITAHLAPVIEVLENTNPWPATTGDGDSVCLICLCRWRDGELMEIHNGRCPAPQIRRALRLLKGEA